MVAILKCKNNYMLLYSYLMRVKLSEQYVNEREEVCKKIINNNI